MKSLIALFLCLCLTTILSAQSKQEKKLLEANEQLRQAMVSGERAALERLTSDQLSYGHSSGLIENRQQFVEKIASGQSDFVSIDLSDQSVQFSGKTAIIRHVLQGKTLDGGKAGEVKLRILLIWQKTNGQWKLLARQAVKMG